MKRGTKVSVTGAECFSGTVVAATEDRMIVEVAPGATATLSRDCASTKPLQWRIAGLPVQVRVEPDLEQFRKRLREVETKARKLGEVTESVAKLIKFAKK